MNQLFRGFERSRCYLKASRQAFSTISSIESASAVSAQNLVSQQAELKRRSHPTTSMPIYLGPIRSNRLLWNDSIVLYRNFSSLSADTDTVQSDDGQEQSTSTIQQSPSALERANLKEVTPGHAVFVLQNYAAGGAALIRQSDFVALCESSRPGKKRDAKVIAVALKEFNQNNRFVLQIAGSRAAVEGMLRSMIPTWKVQDGKPRVQAAVFAAEQILDEKTGMYFAVETLMVDKVLEEFHKGLIEMEENGFKLKVDNIGEKADVEAEEEPSAVEKLLSDAIRVTEEMVKLLIKRKSRPHLDMKKRAKRKYLKRLQISGGPYASTMQLATQISILIGSSAVAQESIVAPWAEAWWTKRKPVDPIVIQMVEAASKMELEQQKAVEAAQASEEVEEDVENDEPNAEDDDEEEDDSQSDVESEEKEKD